ncbi:acyltransferase [candidate division KSB1 bacterium]|nr:MAG: acyltransferase [candidate division KSB1 bacterium]
MLLGIVQTSPHFGDKAANRKQIEELVGDKRADLWVMPELALTGYEFKSRAEVMKLAEEIPHDDSTKWLADFCGSRNSWAVMGLPERDGRHAYNSAIVCGPHRYIGRYRKIHLFDKEKERFDVGNLPFPVFDIGLARVGLMICFDWRFPEAARTLTLRGAQIIAHPSNLVLPHCQKAMVTRALENRVYIATANRIGTEHRAGNTVRFTGGSQLISPDGELLAAATDVTEVLIAEIQPKIADDKNVGLNNLLKDRRPDYYENL